MNTRNEDVVEDAYRKFVSENQEAMAIAIISEEMRLGYQIGFRAGYSVATRAALDCVSGWQDAIDECISILEQAQYDKPWGDIVQLAINETIDELMKTIRALPPTDTGEV